VVITLVLALVAVHLSLSGEMGGLGCPGLWKLGSPFLESTSFIRLIGHVSSAENPHPLLGSTPQNSEGFVLGL
jgi:hypothetical protein